MKRTVLAAAILAAFVPGVVLADMNYTNLEVNYLDLDVGEGVSVNGDGFEIGGSWELNDAFHLFGSWQDQSLDFGIDGRTLELGAGWSHGFSDKLDFVGTLSMVDAELEQGGFTASDDGLAIGGGIRSRLGESFELEAGLKYVTSTSPVAIPASRSVAATTSTTAWRSARAWTPTTMPIRFVSASVGSSN